MEKVFITQFIQLIHYNLPNQACLGKFCVNKNQVTEKTCVYYYDCGYPMQWIMQWPVGNAANTGFLQAW